MFFVDTKLVINDIICRGGSSSRPPASASHAYQPAGTARHSAAPGRAAMLRPTSSVAPRSLFRRHIALAVRFYNLLAAIRRQQREAQVYALLEIAFGHAL